MSDKETAPWMRKAAKRIRIDNALTGGLSVDSIVQIIAAECTAQAPTIEDALIEIGHIALLGVPEGSGFLFRADLVRKVLQKLGATPQGTPTDLLAVIERLANHGSVEDYTVEGIRAELREALRAFRTQGTPDKCPTCGSVTPESFHVDMRNLKWECPDAWHSSAAECPQCGSKDFWTVLPACHGGKAHAWHSKGK